jgi:micrococcal nuclease
MADRLEAAQREAKESQLGLWAPEACGPRAEASLDVVAMEHDPPGNENDNLNDEWVMIRNDGDTLVDLTGWTIRDESASNRFSFPSGFALAPGESVTIHSGCGQDFGTFLHWCSVGAAIWNNDGDTVFVLDPSGNIHITHAYDGNG